MKILMVSPEAAPYAKVGGLGDVVGALPKALANQGHDVRVLLPLYGSIQREDSWEIVEGPLIVNLGRGAQYARLWKTNFENSTATIYFLEHNFYFGRPEVYAGPWGDHEDNPERFTFLSKAGLDLCYKLQWFPDLVHLHDWTTGLVPVYLNTTERYGPLGDTASVFTIHNLKHQGIFHKDVLDFAGLPPSTFRPDGLECMGFLNMMKGGLYHATKLTTVSPTYAKEIQTPEHGCGLEHTLQFRAADLIGVTNGIDTENWNPQTDTLIPETFSAENLSGKATCKAKLQEQFELEKDPSIPVYGVVSRLVHQKGLDVLASILGRLFNSMRIQIVVLGSGDTQTEHAFSHCSHLFPGKFAAYIGYNNGFAHLINAGADFIIMPSRFEPCGLSQLYAMEYGTLPIVRRTGGLVDTVQQYTANPCKGTGFIFDDLTQDALFNTIGWSCATYYDRPADIKTLQQNAMNQDLSWSQSAKKYEEIYKWAIEARLGQV